MSKPNLMALATAIDRNVSEALSEEKRGGWVDLLIEFLPKLLGLCPHRPKPPAPPNPTPNPTPAQASAWEDAWDSKVKAQQAFIEEEKDYDAHALRVSSRRYFRQHKKSGEPITREQAIELARGSLDAARTQPMEKLAAAILEVRPAL